MAEIELSEPEKFKVELEVLPTNIAHHITIMDDLGEREINFSGYAVKFPVIVVPGKTYFEVDVKDIGDYGHKTVSGETDYDGEIITKNDINFMIEGTLDETLFDCRINNITDRALEDIAGMAEEINPHLERKADKFFIFADYFHKDYVVWPEDPKKSSTIFHGDNPHIFLSYAAFANKDALKIGIYHQLMSCYYQNLGERERADIKNMIHNVCVNPATHQKLSNAFAEDGHLDSRPFGALAYFWEDSETVFSSMCTSMKYFGDEVRERVVGLKQQPDGIHAEARRISRRILGLLPKEYRESQYEQQVLRLFGVK